uniref:NADH-ubiquinone oxidoreductase chain 4L n=1 Tax=Micrambina sp. MIC01 TaxID=1227472 RepID=S4SUA9_9CUCU|nr:NADH dehydrogenase subunit 4L [Micrambina sp. MIC01]
MLIYLFMIMFMSGLLSFSLKRKHLLTMLLSLEFIVVSLFMMMLYNMMYLGVESFLCLLFLTFSVCEGALGLSILITMIRTHGNDFILSLTSLW